MPFLNFSLSGYKPPYAIVGRLIVCKAKTI
jgi:hypothetical protein